MSTRLRMPYGKYKNKQLDKLPRSYLRGLVQGSDEKKLVDTLGRNRVKAIRRILDES